ncbi:hypothetical protein [Corynebacterium uterequi]|uniref:Uncharacterized protein n=1 Tax=Corynebacterium uterequi TaxID=1072256 RepID=A0A0G3HBM4_9CORY|nr:hypothetical protein [Corynebacterium uterequi]AKK10659.1 hypothetical protein CUTER_03250 [Corynebacterium uterequi]
MNRKIIEAIAVIVLLVGGVTLVVNGHMWWAALAFVAAAGLGLSAIPSTLPLKKGEEISTRPDPQEVRQYRLDNPGTSLSEAYVAVADVKKS